VPTLSWPPCGPEPATILHAGPIRRVSRFNPRPNRSGQTRAQAACAEPAAGVCIAQPE
jgi:hypothetical protein